ncbi:DUF3846 domain-containing protein [Clostridium baratii]
MVVLVKEPGKKVYRKEIDGSLASLQNIVEGCIELVPSSILSEKKIAIIGNEEARILGLDESLVVLDENYKQLGDVRGNLIFTGVDDTCEFIGLVDEQIDFLDEKIFNNNFKVFRDDGLIIDSLMI